MKAPPSRETRRHLDHAILCVAEQRQPKLNRLRVHTMTMIPFLVNYFSLFLTSCTPPPRTSIPAPLAVLLSQRANRLNGTSLLPMTSYIASLPPSFPSLPPQVSTSPAPPKTSSPASSTRRKKTAKRRKKSANLERKKTKD